MEKQYQTSLPARTTENAPENAVPLLEGAQKQLGFVPNLYRNMANLPSLLATYMDGYNRFREESGFDATEQELVFLTISRLNGCDYCMAAHSMIGDRVAGMAPDLLEAIRQGKELPDSKLEGLSRFTKHVFETAGRPTEAEANRFLNLGFEETQVLAVILALGVKTLSNYVNHVFEPELDEAFANHAWSSNGG